MKRQVTKIIIHCADTYPDMDIGAVDIRQWHLDRGWSDIGYHYVIRRGGQIETGRDLDNDGDILEEVGAHALGYNQESVGICLVGGKPNFNFTLRQLISLYSIIQYLKVEYPDADVIGHNDVTNLKECPMFDVKELFRGADFHANS